MNEKIMVSFKTKFLKLTLQNLFIHFYLRYCKVFQRPTNHQLTLNSATNAMYFMRGKYSWSIHVKLYRNCLRSSQMNKLLLLCILACLVLLASSKPLFDEPISSSERRSACGPGCQILTGVKFGNRKFGGRRKTGKYYYNRFRNSHRE